MERGKKIIIIVTALIAAGFILTTLASYFVSLKSLREQISKRELPLTSDNIYSEVQNDLLKPIFISSLMASDTFLRDWAIEGEKSKEDISKYLKEINEKYGVFTSFFVSENTKKYYYQDGILKKVDEKEIRDRWYFRVKEMAENYEINVDVDMAHNDYLTIFINYKVYDYNRKYIGATGVGLKVDTVKNFIEKYQKNYKSKIYFVDKFGNIKLSSSSENRSIKNIYLIDGLKDIADDIYKQNQEKLFYHKNGKMVLLNSRYIPEFKWYLIVEQEEGENAEKLLGTLLLNIVICLAVVSIVIFLSYNILNRYQDEIHKMAIYDKLTGIYNRQAFEIMIDESIKLCKRNNTKFSIIIFDIDEFKKINDTFGHLAGDRVIKEVAETSKNTIREIDNIFRWGGDEFFVILKECDIKDALEVAEKIRENINKIVPDSSKEISLGISGGIAEYRLGESIEEVIKEADDKLYRAKLKGKNRIEC